MTHHDSEPAQCLPDFGERIERTLDSLKTQAFSKRLWDKDPSLWRQDEAGEKVILNRLGWLDAVDKMQSQVDEILRFADEVKNADFTSAVLMGMGGSSLSPEVSRLTFGAREGYPDLVVLDSTVPSAVLEVEKAIDVARTLFIVSTKSGTTVETLSSYGYFYEKVKAIKGDAAGESFIAITDPGTPLEQEAKDRGFSRLFLNPSDIGGRYSALSYFGLVPAALIGADVGLLLERASRMARSSAPDTPLEENVSLLLGVVMAELAMLGRDKLTLILSPEIKSFGSWIEQLVAESTGKSGRGIVPVDGEVLGDPECYGDDRLFVYVRLATTEDRELDGRVQALRDADVPVLSIDLDDAYDLGGQYFCWEYATGVASALLGVNAFDEPNVKESKDNTARLLGELEDNGELPQESPVLQESGIDLYCSAVMKRVLDTLQDAHGVTEKSLATYLSAFLDLHQPGNYIALVGFVYGSPAVDEVLQCMRGHLRDAYLAATTLGYGPRFLHSTGQLHKGGPNSGLFIQFTADDLEDVEIPGQSFGFTVLKQAQALGDAMALQSKGRLLLRLHLGADVEGNLKRILQIMRRV